MLAFIPNLCCHLEHLGKGSEKGLAQQGTGFGAALGWCCDTTRLFLGLHLTEKMSVEELLPSVTLTSLGCIFRAASAPWFTLLCSMGSLIPNTRRCLSSSGSPVPLGQCQSSLLLHFPRVSVTKL